MFILPAAASETIPTFNPREAKRINIGRVRYSVVILSGVRRETMRSVIPLLLIAASAFVATAGQAAPTGKKAATRDKVAAAPRSPKETAEQVDDLLEAEYTARGVQPGPVTRDDDFLRRVFLDLSGTIPTPKDVTCFGLDPSPEKRTEMIDQLVGAEEFARSWAAYLREVVFSRATETRARVAQRSFEDWLSQQLRDGRHWDEITTDILTATGDVQQQGAAAFVFAHTGQPAELAGEVSRVFLGIQIQCANCHDHPYDKWKREQFHELAAFFPRIQVRQDLQSRPPVFTVSSADFREREERFRNFFTPEQTFLYSDRNQDGQLTKSEVGQRGPFAGRFDQLLELADKNKDGGLQLEELKEALANRPERPGRGSSEYYMPDLNDPSSKGELIEPKFFADGLHVDTGANDQERRRALAKSITDKSNPWFAKAFVNRIWTELLGEGFYNPVDDIGPQRECLYPEALDALSTGFVASDYDIQWLFRTITRTRAYQRAVGQRQPGEASPAFATAIPTRLRSDQIYSALQKVLGVEGIGAGRGAFQGMGQGNGVVLRQLAGSDPGRFVFFQLFNFDPSTPQSDILGTVPQALFMMNSPLISQLINGSFGTVLSQTLQQYPDDADALSEIYLRVLCREPADVELTICREHIASASSRQQAYEDILWSLLNSSEFVTKR
ncbi:MAG: DUF1549 domain-containing protein [Planctomycetaceae bacterium]